MHIAGYVLTRVNTLGLIPCSLQQALSERGQRLDDVVENTARMRDQAVVNEEAGKTLRGKYTNQKWWKW